MSTADELSIRSLLNCYHREISQPRNQFQITQVSETLDIPGVLRQSYPDDSVLRIYLPNTGMHLLALIDSQIAKTQGFEYLNTLYFQKPPQIPWTRANLLALTEIISSELSHQYACRAESDFLKNIQDSHRVMELILETSRTSSRTIDSLNFIVSEQSLVSGHPFHPSPKSRIDFSDKEVMDYSPEFGPQFLLHYFGVQKEFIVQESLEVESAHQLIRKSLPSSTSSLDLNLGTDPDLILVPVHPWQAKYLLKQPEIQTASRAGKIVNIGQMGSLYYPTSSVRTVYSPLSDYFYKLSLNVRITNCIRRNSLEELQSSLEITRLMKELRFDYSNRHPNFITLEEPAYLTIDFQFGEKESDKKITEGFGLGLRSTQGLRSHDEVTPILTASLFGNQKLGRTWLKQFFSSSILSPQKWFEQYLRLLLPPVLNLFFERGLMFEAHLQNTLVGLKDNLPTKIYIRDFDNARVVEGSWAGNRLKLTRPVIYRHSVFTEKQAWNRLVYCLIVNHLIEAIEQISRTEETRSMKTLEKDLYLTLREELEAYSSKSSDQRMREYISNLLSEDTLPAKANLLTRFQRTPDAEASYVRIPNPLCR